ALGQDDLQTSTERNASLAQPFPGVEPAFTALTHPPQPPSLVAAVRCLHRAIEQLRETLLLPPTLSATESPTSRDWEWLPFGTRSLLVALSRRLLWLPELQLADDGQPVSDALPHIAPLLRATCAAGRTLRAAFAGWLEQQDYRFVDILLHVLHRSESDFPTLSRRYQEALADSRATLCTHTSQTQIAVEQAVVDNIITDERPQYNAKVEALHPDETLHFAPQYAALQQIGSELADARVKRLVALRETDSFVEEESCAPLAAARAPLAEFLEAIPPIEAWMEKEVGLLQPIATDIRQGRTRAGIAFGELPAAQLREASTAIETWRQLKQRKAQGDSSVQSITLL